MSGYAHALMQDTYNANDVRIDAVDDDVGANQVSQVRRWQIIVAMTKLRIMTNRLQRIVDFVAVNQKLVLTPGFSGMAQDVDKILPSFRGEFEWPRFMEGHRGSSADRYAWR